MSTDQHTAPGVDNHALERMSLLWHYTQWGNALQFVSWWAPRQDAGHQVFRDYAIQECLVGITLARVEVWSAKGRDVIIFEWDGESPVENDACRWRQVFAKHVVPHSCALDHVGHVEFWDVAQGSGSLSAPRRVLRHAEIYSFRHET
eukprot:2529798-Rhodomonas_salina.1